MPFGHTARPTRAYAYHARLLSGGESIRAELRRRTALWNALVEVDRDLRERRDVLLDTWRGLSREAHDARRDEIAALRRAARTDPALHRPADRMEYEDRQARRPAYQDPAVKAALAPLEAEAYERSKALLYAPLPDRCCWWPVSNATRLAWQQARHDPMPTRFHRPADEDTLDIQLIGGRAVDELVAGHWASRGFVQLSPFDPDRRQRHAETPLRLRVSGTRLAPEWADLLVCFHRPLPPGGQVQAVQLTRRLLANQTYWTIIFLVALPERTQVPAPRAGTVWLDLGWRRMADRLRIAVWRDDAGRTGELTLPARWLAARAKVGELRSIRDQRFDLARADLAAWLASHGAPEWLRLECRTLAQWRSPGRLAALLGRWRAQRFPGDETIYPALAEHRDPKTGMPGMPGMPGGSHGGSHGRRDDWLAVDRHLWQWERHGEDQAIAQRREQYRCFAAHLARTYGTVVLEEADWAALARKAARGTPATDAATARDRAVEDTARRHRHWAGISTLELAISNAMAREGGLVQRAASPYTTATCAHCGSVERWDHVTLRHTCSQCGATWDQDENTVRVLAGVR